MLEKATTSQRGEMSRLAIEVKAGVFVATINSRVRDILWHKICQKWDVNALMIYSTNREQGYALRSHGDPKREAIDSDGAYLLAREYIGKGARTAKHEDNSPEIGENA
jgi:CRISPR-associated protein Cas2